MPTRHDQPDRTPDRVKDRPTWLVSRVYARSTALLTAGFEAGGKGLRGYHYRLLAALEQWGPASQADLGRDTGIDRSDVTAALTELEKRDLVERRVDPDHKRRNIVTITPQGLGALEELDDVIDGIQSELLAPLTAAQRRQFVALLSRILDR
ncbi:MarR family transcriptional regulator [Streptomyces sp. NPDC001795]|uniref:MarR family winged helix-turn-helix transcriptional regulator n=1 Tax=unclassified Streptomyces TaxID=2593676 RepID=UPI00332837E1